MATITRPILEDMPSVFSTLTTRLSKEWCPSVRTQLLLRQRLRPQSEGLIPTQNMGSIFTNSGIYLKVVPLLGHTLTLTRRLMAAPIRKNDMWVISVISRQTRSAHPISVSLISKSPCMDRIQLLDDLWWCMLRKTTWAGLTILTLKLRVILDRGWLVGRLG